MPATGPGLATQWPAPRVAAASFRGHAEQANPAQGCTMPAKRPPRNDRRYWDLKPTPPRSGPSLRVTPAVLALIHNLDLPLDAEIKAFAILAEQMGWEDIPRTREDWFPLLARAGGTVD